MSMSDPEHATSFHPNDSEEAVAASGDYSAMVDVDLRHSDSEHVPNAASRSQQGHLRGGRQRTFASVGQGVHVGGQARGEGGMWPPRFDLAFGTVTRGSKQRAKLITIAYSILDCLVCGYESFSDGWNDAITAYFVANMLALVTLYFRVSASIRMREQHAWQPQVADLEEARQSPEYRTIRAVNSWMCVLWMVILSVAVGVGVAEVLALHNDDWEEFVGDGRWSEVFRWFAGLRAFARVALWLSPLRIGLGAAQVVMSFPYWCRIGAKAEIDAMGDETTPARAELAMARIRVLAASDPCSGCNLCSNMPKVDRQSAEYVTLQWWVSLQLANLIVWTGASFFRIHNSLIEPAHGIMTIAEILYMWYVRCELLILPLTLYGIGTFNGAARHLRQPAVYRDLERLDPAGLPDRQAVTQTWGEDPPSILLFDLPVSVLKVLAISVIPFTLHVATVLAT